MADKHSNVWAALAAAQAECGPLKANAKNPHFKNNYANLNSVLDLIREPMANNGLCMFQTMNVVDGRTIIETTLTHSSGGNQVMSSAILPAKDLENPQAIGSAISYFRRYMLISLFALNAEDDDGQRSRANTRQNHATTSQTNANPETGEIPDDPAEDQRRKDLARISILWKEVFTTEDQMRKDLFETTGKESRTDLTVADRRGYIRHLEKLRAPDKLVAQALDETPVAELPW